MERRRFLTRTAHAAVGAAMLPEMLLAAEAKGGLMVSPVAGAGPARLSVRDASFGVVGDGVTKDTVGLQQALDRCAALGGGEVLVPEGRYLTGSIQIRSNTVLRMAEGAVLLGSPDFEDYAVTQVRWEGRWIAGHIALVYAIDAAGVGVMGPGKIVGHEAMGGRPTKEQPLRHPALMEFLRCDGVHLQGFSTSYYRMWSIHPTSSRNLLIEDLVIRSTGGNGDGIDVDSCQRVVIRRCDISTGDDCISLKSGRGGDAFLRKVATEDVLISDCTFADSLFACIGIGSENSGDTRRVRVERCKFTGAKSHAIYIKSRPGRGAVLEDMTFEDLDVSGVAAGFLRINLLNSGLLGEDPVAGLAGIPQGRNLVFRNVRVVDVPVLVHALEISPLKPLDGLVLENISGTCVKGIEIANAKRVAIKDVRVSGYSGPMVSVLNVTGKGLEGAGVAAMEGMKTPEPVPEPATPYVLR